MFWGSFSYYEKGPCHIWEPETAAEKRASKEDLKKRNAKIEAECKKKWQEKVEKAAEEYFEKYKKKKGGPKPRWIFGKTNGAIVREKGRGGIDWYRYQAVILKGKLLPWVKKMKRKLKQDLIVQEDGAPAHASQYQQRVFDSFEVLRMIWPGNSPDLNAIKPCWFYMKRETTKRGVFGKKDIKERWIQCWNDLPQEQIQAWIDRIPIHIEKVILLEGGNEYQEGRLKGEEKKRVH
jgi:hypothetical protein